MKVDISELKENRNASMELSFLEPVTLIKIGGEEITFNGPASVELFISNDTDFFTIYGSVSVEAFLRCSRCLKVFTFPLKGTIEAQYRQVSPGYEGIEDADLKVFNGNEIDVTSDIKEGLILSLPVKAVCFEECKGLCPTCGKDLNKGKCECKIEDIDPRLAVLKDLLKE